MAAQRAAAAWSAKMLKAGIYSIPVGVAAHFGNKALANIFHQAYDIIGVVSVLSEEMRTHPDYEVAMREVPSLKQVWPRAPNGVLPPVPCEFMTVGPEEPVDDSFSPLFEFCTLHSYWRRGTKAPLQR